MSDDPIHNRIYRFLSGSVGTRGTQAFGDLSIASTLGRVRSENQDASLILTARYGRQPYRDFDVAVLCDGMGGMKGGREAAQTALCTFMAVIIRSTRVAVPRRLHAAIQAANRDVYHLLNGRGGTTLSAVIIERDRLPVCCHVGDSRLYAISGMRVSQLSRDDTLEAALNRNRSLDDRRDNRLLQFVGMGDDLQPHIFPASPDADRYLITSDGAHDLPFHTFQRVATNAPDALSLTTSLIRMSEFTGGLDNATAATLPSRINTQAYETHEGLDLQLLSAFGRLDMWIPQLHEGSRNLVDAPREERAHKDGDAQVALDTPPQREGKPKTKRAKRKSTGPRKKPSEPEDLEQPSLMIEFPDGGEE